MRNHSVWKPICYDDSWNSVKTERFDNLLPSWEKRRAELSKYPVQYDRFIEQLKRKQAIETGIIERLYDLKKGVTETFIEKGFVDAYLQRGDTDIAPDLLMDYLRDNSDAIDFIFDFVKNDRLLSVGYIKELHSLITQHQDTTDAIDQFGNRIKIPLLKGQFKVSPNNPKKNSIIYNYCPPIQVDSEMDALIRILNIDFKDSHVLVKAAFLHHAFTQIHPFQDGNGRLARLIASFILIKEGLFPLSLDRDDRTKYIDALESADENDYQPIIEIFADNQISSIERALNWKTVEYFSGYDNVLDVFDKKLTDYRASEAEHQSKQILVKMISILEEIKLQMVQIKDDLGRRLGGSAEVNIGFCAPDERDAHLYNKQIISYANIYNYFANLSLQRCWGRLLIKIDDTKTYRIVFSLHHYGYDNSTFAIGAFLSKAIPETQEAQLIDIPKNDYIDIPLGIPPLTMSSDKDASELTASIKQQTEKAVVAAFACIANELG